MNIKQKKIQRKRLFVATVAAIMIAVIGTSGTIFALHNTSQTVKEASDNKSVESMFSFSDSQGWWQGVTTKTSMVVFDSNSTHACFVMFEYIPGTVNVDAGINKVNAELTKFGEGYIISPLSSQALELRTNSRSLSYELRQSSVVTPPGAEKVKGGQAFGYIQLPDGYVKIAGYCDTPEQLPNILTALNAVKFDKSK